MAEFPTMPLRTDALIGDTMHLSAAEFGGYVRLLVAMWRNGATLPDDDARLMRFAGMSAREWRRSRDVLMEFMTRTDDGQWTQKRLRKEWLAVTAKCKQAARSANARWLKEKETPDAFASPQQCERNATHDPVSKETTSVVSEKRARPPRKTVPPKDWTPTSEQVAFAIGEGLPPERVKSLIATFRDWHQSERKTRSPSDNFNATWQNWVRREVAQMPRKEQSHGQRGQNRTGSPIFDAAVRFAERERASRSDTGGFGEDDTGESRMDCGPRFGAVVPLLAAGGRGSSFG